MQRKITYYVDKIKPGQKISGFLKEKGYSEQNLVNLKKNLKSIEVPFMALLLSIMKVL